MRSLCLWSMLVLAACSGGGNSASGGAQPAPTKGAVRLVVDTSTAADGLVQFLVIGAAFGADNGETTGNLLAQPELVTLADPTGDGAGLVLPSVPAGSYDTLQLVLAPDSGSVLFADGNFAPLAGPLQLEVPLLDGLQHDGTSDSWVVIGDDGGSTIVTTASGWLWQPQLAGRLDQAAVDVVLVDPVVLEGGDVVATAPIVDGLLTVELLPGCGFADEAANEPMPRGDFLRDLNRGDELRITGELQRDGRIRASRASRGRGHGGPRLLGRIVELRPATTSFVLRVRAQTRAGEVRLVEPPVDVLVLAANARIARPNRHVYLAFGDLAVDDLVKVKVRSRTEVPGSLPEVVASEIEVPGGDGGHHQPEWTGLVQSVDLVGRTIVVVPRPGKSIVVGGQTLASVEVAVAVDTSIQRRERRGPGRYPIGLEGILPGQDRIEWRGVVTGPAAIAATWLQVRLE